MSRRQHPARPDRRRFLAAVGGLGTWAALAGCASRESAGEGTPEPGSEPVAPPERPDPLYRISLAEWSLHRTLGTGELDNLGFPALAREAFGIEAVEYVNSFFKDKAHDEAYLAQLRQRCADAGVQSLLIMIDGEGHLGTEDEAERGRAIANHRPWIDAAAFLGCHSIRVNARGGGPPDELAARAADSLVRLADYGAPSGISVIVENHGGLSSDGAWLAGVMERAAHPGVGSLPDFGNFRVDAEREYDRYQGVRELMPYAKAVSAKSHDFDEQGFEIHTDYRRMMRIVVEAGYHGYVGVEYEGNARSEHEGIRLTVHLLERVRGEFTG